MSYMDALRIKIRNRYSKWPPLARTQPLSLRGRSSISIKLRNTSSGKSAAAFRRDRFKLSMLGCLFLQHPLPWTELELPAGLSTQHTRHGQPSSCRRQMFRTSPPLQIDLLYRGVFTGVDERDRTPSIRQNK